MGLCRAGKSKISSFQTGCLMPQYWRLELFKPNTTQAKLEVNTCPLLFMTNLIVFATLDIPLQFTCACMLKPYGALKSIVHKRCIRAGIA
eukprot:1161491-Pelagomonas_calceolata.AAC.18